ncbi:MAG: 4Fe-4S dicluster domain-containing protein [Candidatus Marinimicrobia bacterium]|nr:4Fe-4S dicluster domain-containing protein [Candidatus Neomarinimicrobiota bacterium]
MATRKIVLHFPPSIVNKPLIYKLTKEYDIEFNILKASISPEEEGLLVLELNGETTKLNNAIKFLEKENIKIQSLDQDIIHNLEKCTHCGLCVPICPTFAFEKNPVTHEINFIKEKCIACEFCVKVCPYDALTVNFAV